MIVTCAITNTINQRSYWNYWKKICKRFLHYLEYNKIDDTKASFIP